VQLIEHDRFLSALEVGDDRLIAMQLHSHCARARLHDRETLGVELRLGQEDVNPIRIHGLADR
jgi:hypothetical protein